MDYLADLHQILSIIQRTISFVGVIIILSGILIALGQYLYYAFTGHLINQESKVNGIRLNLSRILILGLEFIVAADIIGTTTTPDYHSAGLLAIIVIVRTLLTFSLNREIATLSTPSIFPQKSTGS